MSRAVGRRRYLRTIGGAATVGGLAASAVAVNCGATVYPNATEEGEPKLAVPSGEATIVGQSTCEPGIELAVVARNTGNGLPFLKRGDTTIGDTGGWSVTIDFGDIGPGTTFELEVHHVDGYRLDTLSNCEVVAEPPSSRATPSRRPTRTASSFSHTETRTASATSRNTHAETRTPLPHSETPMTPTDLKPANGGDGRWSGWTSLLLAPLVTYLVTGTVGLLAVAGMLVRWRLRSDESGNADGR